MGTIIPLRPDEYTAKQFNAGRWIISGTLCGCIDIAAPDGLTHCLTPDEANDLVTAITSSRHDVLENSRPYSDPRLYDPGDVE